MPQQLLYAFHCSEAYYMQYPAERRDSKAIKQIL